MFYQTNSVMWNISHIESECGEYLVGSTLLYGIFSLFSMSLGNILQNIVTMTKQCYGSE
jgi:hypothetical protein